MIEADDSPRVVAALGCGERDWGSLTEDHKSSFISYLDSVVGHRQAGSMDL